MKLQTTSVDVVLIGAGIMSGTLGVMLKQLEPSWTIEVFERLDLAAAESSDAWNNAGTGHAAFCELNYTPQNEDGTVDTSKAVQIAAAFEESRQFWSYLVKNNLIDVPGKFITRIPHMSFVRGAENQSFLRQRYETMQSCHLFKGMEYTEDHTVLNKWVPLIMQERDSSEPVAATRMAIGTDVNFGSLTRCMFQMLGKSEGVQMHYNHEVADIDKENDGTWDLKVRDLETGESRHVNAKFVFIGAGGGSLPLLLKSGIEEGKGFGGFPVSGQWLRCNNRELIEQHHAKVYGVADVGAPPMSVPHLDTRIIKGKKELLFGPYAGFTTRFLKQGSLLDLFKSIRLTNIWPMLAAGYRNIPLTKYLIEQVKLTHEQRVDALRKFVPTAKEDEWELEVAGQRVQVIKKDDKKGGILQFGTEVVSGKDGSLAALLGASPGASTAVSIMFNVMSKCFPSQYNSPQWQNKLQEMVPSFGKSLSKDGALLREMRAYTQDVLELRVNEKI